MEAADLSRLAQLHGECFPDDRWDTRALAELLSMPGASGHLIEDLDQREPLGLLMDLIVAGEAEILTLGVTPPARRQGVAQTLLDHLFARAIEAGARHIGLEVAADNLPARQLYLRCGFGQVGRRRGYYRRGAATVDALLFRRLLRQ